MVISNRATIRQIRDLFTKKPATEPEGAQNSSINISQRGVKPTSTESVTPKTENKELSIVDLFDNFSLSHNYQINVTKTLKGKRYFGYWK